MDNNENLSNELLKRDGINPVGVSDTERAKFKAMLEAERKRVKRLAWIVQIPLWLSAISLLLLCVSERLLEALHIPFIAAWAVLMLLVSIVLIPLAFRLLARLKSTRVRLRRLQKLMPGYADKRKQTGIVIVGAEDGKSIIKWPAVISLGIAVWIFTGLVSTGIYYLLAGRWSPSLIMYSGLMSMVLVGACVYQGLKTPIEELTKLKPTQPNILRTIMKSRITKFATAGAVIIVAVLIGISTFNGTTAWARVIKALEEVENIHIVNTITMPDGTQVQCKWWLRRPNCLYEDFHNRIVIDNGQERLTIDKEKKTAQFSDSLLPYKPLAEHYMYESINLLRGESSEEVEFVKLDDESDETTLVFRIHSKHSTTEAEGKAWIDALTMLPRKIQAELVSETHDDNPKSGEITCNYEPIADDVFAMVIPEGFTELPRKQRGVMSGKVLDEHEQPVSNAIVYVTDRTGQFSEQTITDESGQFTFKLPPEGVGAYLWLPVLLRAFVEDDPDRVAWTIIRRPDNKREPGGKIPGEVAYIDNNGSRLKSANGINLRMEPAGTIAGQVTDIEGNPIADAKVSVTCNPVDKFGNEVINIGNLGESTSTDKKGRYQLDNLPKFWDKTVFILGASAKGYVTESIRFRSKGPMDYKQVDFQLYRAALTVSGVVVDNYGELLSERQIYARVSGKDYRACRTKTDESGRFRLVGCPATPDLQIKAELSHNTWPPHEKERSMSYRYHPDVIVGIDYEAGKTEYEVKLVAERPEIIIDVELKNTAGEPLPYFPVEVRGTPGSISSQWRADKKLDQRTDERGYCRFTEVPNVENLRVVMWGGDSVWNETLSKKQLEKIKKKYKKYKWTEVPVEFVPGRKEYKVEVTLLMNEEYDRLK